MALTPYQRAAYRLFGARAGPQAERNLHLRITLQRAHIPLRPEVYLSYAWLNIALAVGGSALLLGAALAAEAYGGVELPPQALWLLAPLPFVLGATSYVLALALPDLRAAARARDIDAKLPYALNYIATMAAAGITPERIFETLARQRIYGEVANEAAWISRDMRLLGKDVVGALTAAIDRSPSIKFQDLLQGAISALTSGGDLKQYFLGKSEQFTYENRQEQRNFLATLAVLAESFVTVVVAAPLFLLVLLSVMATFGASAAGSLGLGYVLIFVLLPLAQAAFVMAIKFVTPEV